MPTKIKKTNKLSNHFYCPKLTHSSIVLLANTILRRSLNICNLRILVFDIFSADEYKSLYYTRLAPKFVLEEEQLKLVKTIFEHI